MDKGMYDVIVVGGGVGGMQAAISLKQLGHTVALLEAQDELGGKLLQYANLFPTLEQAEAVVNQLKQLVFKSNIDVMLNSTVCDVVRQENFFEVFYNKEKARVRGRSVVLAYGFDFFDPMLKEEYGYGIIRGVYTSVDFEKMMKENSFEQLFGTAPSGFGFVHCVGSRDEKVKNNYCSKVCCITAIKQAIEIKEQFPKAEVFCYYMDLRLHELYFEKWYKQAQKEHGIHFIRGKVSEVANSSQGKVVFKVEDTLLSRPLRLELDGLFLMIGMESSAIHFPSLPLPLNEYDFFEVGQEALAVQGHHGIFGVGTVKGPRSIKETLQDAVFVSMQVHDYLKQYHDGK